MIMGVTACITMGAAMWVVGNPVWTTHNLVWVMCCTLWATHAGCGAIYLRPEIVANISEVVARK